MVWFGHIQNGCEDDSAKVQTCKFLFFHKLDFFLIKFHIFQSRLHKHVRVMLIYQSSIFFHSYVHSSREQSVHCNWQFSIFSNRLPHLNKWKNSPSTTIFDFNSQYFGRLFVHWRYSLLIGFTCLTLNGDIDDVLNRKKRVIFLFWNLAIYVCEQFITFCQSIWKLKFGKNPIKFLLFTPNYFFIETNISSIENIIKNRIRHYFNWIYDEINS